MAPTRTVRDVLLSVSATGEIIPVREQRLALRVLGSALERAHQDLTTRWKVQGKNWAVRVAFTLEAALECPLAEDVVRDLTWAWERPLRDGKKHRRRRLTKPQGGHRGYLPDY